MPEDTNLRAITLKNLVLYASMRFYLVAKEPKRSAHE